MRSAVLQSVDVDQWSEREVAAPRTESSWINAASLLAVLILVTVFEGAGRKWLFPNSSALRYAAYFAKDALFLLLAAYALWRGRRQNLSWIVACGFLILIPSALATFERSNVVGIWLSFRAYLVVPACAFLAAPLLQNVRDAERLAIAVLLSAMIVVPLGIRQYNLPKNHILNRVDSGAEESEGISRAGHTRAAGTFSGIGGMGLMAGVVTWAGTFLAFPLPGRSVYLRLLGAFGVGAGLICASVAMSRTGLVFWVAVLVGSVLLYMRVSRALTLLLGGIAVAWLLFSAAPSEDIDAIVEQDSLATGLLTRLSTGDAMTERLSYMGDNLVRGLFNHPFGEGLGLGQPGGQYAATGISTGLGGYESEWGRIAFEVGAAGLIGVISIRLVAIFICWRSLRTAGDKGQRLVLATALPFFALMSTGKMAFNHVGNAFAWAVMAVALGAALAGKPEDGEDAHIHGDDLR